MSPSPSERVGSSHQLSSFYPLKQKHQGKLQDPQIKDNRRGINTLISAGLCHWHLV